MNESQNTDFLVAEYSALRNEIVKRMEMRHQFVIYALVVAGAFLSLGAQKEVSFIVPLMYPVLAFFLAWGWTHNDIRVAELGVYIQEEVEDKLGLKMWQTWKDEQRKKRPKSRRFEGFEHTACGAFLGTQLLALIVAWSKLDFALWNLPFFAVPGAVLMYFTGHLILRRRRGHAKARANAHVVEMAAERSPPADAENGAAEG